MFKKNHSPLCRSGVVSRVPSSQPGALAAARFRFQARSEILIAILELGVSSLCMCSDVCCSSNEILLTLVEALTYCWAQIQGGPSLCTCIVFWSIVSGSPSSRMTHEHLGCKSLPGTYNPNASGSHGVGGATVSGPEH